MFKKNNETIAKEELCIESKYNQKHKEKPNGWRNSVGWAVYMEGNGPTIFMVNDNEQKFYLPGEGSPQLKGLDLRFVHFLPQMLPDLRSSNSFAHGSSIWNQFTHMIWINHVCRRRHCLPQVVELEVVAVKAVHPLVWELCGFGKWSPHHYVTRETIGDHQTKIAGSGGHLWPNIIHFWVLGRAMVSLRIITRAICTHHGRLRCTIGWVGEGKRGEL